MLSSAFADGPFPRGHSRSAMKLSQSFHVHGIAPSRNRTKAPRSPVPRHANFSNTLSDAPRFRGRPFPRGHSRSAMKLSQIFRVHGIAPSRNRTKAPHAPAPVNFSNMLSSAFADGPFPRRHTRITKSHPESSAGSAHAPASPCHADRSRAVSLSLASLSPRPASPHLLQSAAFASSPPTSQTPSPSPPRFRGRPFPRRHTRITKSHPESSAGSAHVPTPPCHADRSRAASLSLASLSRVPHPRAYSKAPHAPAHRQLFKYSFRRHPASRTALLRTDIRAAPWDPTETSVATIGHPFPAHPRPLPCPLAKNALPAKRGRRPAERYFRDRRLIVRLV